MNPEENINLSKDITDALDTLKNNSNLTEKLYDFAQQYSINTLTISTNYNTFSKSNSLEDSPYSKEFKSAADYFQRFEIEVSNFSDLIKAVEKIISRIPNSNFLWRGQGDYRWGVHSSLFRYLMKENGVTPADQNPSGNQEFPTEEQLQSAESRIISYVRSEWRLGNINALELLAMLQHHGAPTRLLDVSRNPLIATWFALEQNEELEDIDARIVAFSNKPVLEKKQSEKDFILSNPNDFLTDSMPFWHNWKTKEEMIKNNWGTGAHRRIWVPPLYDPRIPAQNAAFIIDGVPIVTTQTASYFKKNTEKNNYWKKSDLLASSSIYIRLENPYRMPKEIKPLFSPTYSIRIKADSKDEIRRKIENTFSYSKSSIYPDISGAAQYINKDFSEIINN